MKESGGFAAARAIGLEILALRLSWLSRSLHEPTTVQSMWRGLLLLLLVNDVALAQSRPPLTPVWKDFSAGWDPMSGLFYPPDKSRATYQNEPTALADYEKELRKQFSANKELAKRACAAFEVVPPPFGKAAFPFPNYGQLRDLFPKICKDFRPGKEIMDEVTAVLTDRPSPRQAIARTRSFTIEERNRLVADGALYLPPPATAADWRAGTAFRDYSADVLAAFDADPILAAAVCESAERNRQEPLRDAKLDTLRPQLLKVCSAFPLEKIVAASKNRQRDDAFAYMRGLLNTYTDQAATMSEAARRDEVNRIVALPRGTTVSEHFPQALKVIALDPENDWGPLLALTHEAVANTGKAAIRSQDVRAFLDQIYSIRSKKAGAEGRRWRRGWRGYLLATTQFEKARDLAREIVSSNLAAGDNSPQDRIYLAALERLSGDEVPYQELMANCPEPDPGYLARSGRPPTAERYCEDEVAALTSRVLKLLGDSAPAPLRVLFAETNRVTSKEPAVATLPSPPVQKNPVLVATERYSALMSSELERARRLDESIRWAEAAKIYSAPGTPYGDEGIAKGLRVIALDPGEDAGPWFVLLSLRDVGDPNPEKTAIMELLPVIYQREIAGAPEKEDWKRGWRSFLLYTGALNEALKLSRELMNTPNPHDTPSDRVILALLDRANGNPAPMKELLANCPAPPPYYVSLRGANARGYCREQLYWISYRALRRSHTSTPQIFKDVILETMNREHWAAVVSTLDLLQEADLKMAEAEFHRLWKSPPEDMPELAKWDIFVALREIAEKKKDYKTAIEYSDRLIEKLSPGDPGFDPRAWAELAAFPETTTQGIRYRENSPLFRAFEHKVRNALELDDYKMAQRTLETLLSFTRETGEIAQVRVLLVEIADRMISRGKRQEPLRILGYLSTHPLDKGGRQQLDYYLEQLARTAPTKLEPARAPWDSSVRPDLRKEKPETPRDTSPVT